MINLKLTALAKLTSLNMNLSKAFYWYDESPDYSPTTTDPMSPGVNITTGILNIFLVCADKKENVAGFQIVQFIPRADGTMIHLYSFDSKGKIQNVKSKEYKTAKQAKEVFLRGFSDIAKWGPEGKIEMRLVHSVELADMANKYAKLGLKLTDNERKPVKVSRITVPAEYR